MKIFSLGGACRPGYHLKKNSPSNFVSGPFDWTLSSAKSIYRFFGVSYVIDKCLSPGNIRFGANGMSVKCNYSDLDFFHGLGPIELQELRAKDGRDFHRYSATPSSYLLNSEHFQSTRQRFLFTARRLQGMCIACEEPLVFVRWVGCGLNNPQIKIPDAHHADLDDNAINMSSAISTLHPSLDFEFVQIQSVYNDSAGGGKHILEVDVVSKNTRIIFLEESMPLNFIGDERAWSELSNYITEELSRE